MRGPDKLAGSQFSGNGFEKGIPERPPPRKAKAVANAALRCAPRMPGSTVPTPARAVPPLRRND